MLPLSVNGGCSRFQYISELDVEPKPNGRVFTKKGGKFVVDKSSYGLVKGAYVEELIRSAFLRLKEFHAKQAKDKMLPVSVEAGWVLASDMFSSCMMKMNLNQTTGFLQKKVLSLLLTEARVDL